MACRLKQRIHNFVNDRTRIAVLCGWIMTGFGQIYNGEYIKGLLFFIPNFLSNQYGHLNEALLYAFLGEIEKSQSVLNYQWILYYPSWFAMSHFDAYKVAYQKQNAAPPPISYKFPFITSAMFSTVSIIIGSRYFPGPIFWGLGGYFFGFALGISVVKIAS